MITTNSDCRSRVSTAWAQLLGRPAAPNNWMSARHALWQRKCHCSWCFLIPKFSQPFNPAELGARQRVRKRDVSLQARTRDGISAWDTFETLVATAKKLGAHIPQFTERENRFDKRLSQADGERVDGEVVAPKPGFGFDLPYECGEGQSPQNTEKSSA